MVTATMPTFTTATDTWMKSFGEAFTETERTAVAGAFPALGDLLSAETKDALTGLTVPSRCGKLWGFVVNAAKHVVHPQDEAWPCAWRLDSPPQQTAPPPVTVKAPPQKEAEVDFFETDAYDAMLEAIEKKHDAEEKKKHDAEEEKKKKNETETTFKTEFMDEDDDFFASEELDKAVEAAEKSYTERKQKRKNDDGPSETELKECLQDVWGHDDFRSGQLSALTALGSGNDVAVYWATGSGKSLVYQVPAMVNVRRGNKKVVLVISPLVSLMEDQVKGMNIRMGREVACFLGTAQLDRSIEARAIRGDFALVYATPEKAINTDLTASLQDKLALIAIDEAHCISEWGADFRPDYRRLQSLRSRLLEKPPLVVLTATATPPVRKDVESSIGLRPGFHVESKSVDRPNLYIAVRSKAATTRATMDPILADLAKEESSGSTIIYCATRRQVDDAYGTLKAHVGDKVVAYHAGLDADVRKEAHLAFLTGRATFVVASVAFGMGIDKADVRRIIHLGPPKTFEEYYQQIGRAGRDGRPAQCIMFAVDTDFDKYSSQFYLGNLTAQAREAVTTSTARLRAFARASATASCRRAMILHYFDNGEISGGTWRCGACDLCDEAGDPNEKKDEGLRDYTHAARRVSVVVQALGSASMTVITNILQGSGDQTQYVRARASIRHFDQQQHHSNNKKMTKDDWKWFLPALVQHGVLSSEQKQNDNYTSRPYTVYGDTTKAGRIVRGESFRMPPPRQVLEKEREERLKREERTAARLQELTDAGVDVTTIPQEELDAGTGPVLTAELQWSRTLRSWRERGMEDRAAQHESVLQRILAWRLRQADEHHVAPVTVLADHVAKKVAYTLPTEVNDLRAVGVRVGADGLALVVQTAVTDLGLRKSQEANESVIPLPRGAWGPATPWSFAVYRPAKNGKPKAWELSYDRFTKGESVGAIATNQANGKAIQTTTVVKHLLTALTFGRRIDLQRLHDQGKAALPIPCGAPSEATYDRFDAALAAAADEVDVLGSETYPFAALARAFGDPVADIADIDYKDRSEHQNALYTQWGNDRAWWESLKRAGYDPAISSLEPPAKIPRRSLSDVVDLT